MHHLTWPGRGVPVVRNHEEDVLDLSGLKYVLTIRHVRYVQCPAPGRRHADHGHPSGSISPSCAEYCAEGISVRWRAYRASDACFGVISLRSQRQRRLNLKRSAIAWHKI